MAIAPLVVVPRDNLQHVIAHDHGERGVNGGGDVGASEIARHERFVGDGEDALELAIGGFAEGLVDFIGGDLLGGLDDEIDDETFGVGTRSAMPLSLPLSCGKTSATALAAPVEVGTMFKAAARARRKSR